VNGYLIFKSGYLPKLIGVLMQIAGLSYLTACFAALFCPDIRRSDNTRNPPPAIDRRILFLPVAAC
jgi:hypothetical protein